MKKLTVLIMILGLTAWGELVESAGAQAGTGLQFNDNPATDNVFLTASSGIVIGIQSDDGLVCIVYLEPTDGVGQRVVPARGDIINLFPDVMTIASLGLVGLLLRRRKNA
jgi:hypothetical protein